MTAKNLLDKSKQHLAAHPHFIQHVYHFGIFESGAQWMAARLAEIRKQNVDTVPYRNFSYYGLLKYGICILAFVLSLIFLIQFSIFLIPVSVLVFYFVEVHFLFLFPLLIDDIERPLLESIRLTYKIGVIHSISIVVRIAAYMLSGLFETAKPFKKWHVGCLAVLFWYESIKSSE